MDDDLDIRTLLDFSRQQDELIAGHQQQMQQVLANNRYLRSALERSQTTIEAQQQKIEELREEVAQLRKDKQQLLNRPTNIEAGTYIERQSVRQQVLAIPRHKTNAAKQLTSQDQLSLWANGTSL